MSNRDNWRGSSNPRPHVECKDGWQISIQANQHTNCFPRERQTMLESANAQYATVEIACTLDDHDAKCLGEPTDKPRRKSDFFSDSELYGWCVNGYVNVEIVSKILARHGGVIPEHLELLPPGVKDWQSYAVVNQPGPSPVPSSERCNIPTYRYT